MPGLSIENILDAAHWLLGRNDRQGIDRAATLKAIVATVRADKPTADAVRAWLANVGYALADIAEAFGDFGLGGRAGRLDDIVALAMTAPAGERRRECLTLAAGRALEYGFGPDEIKAAFMRHGRPVPPAQDGEGSADAGVVETVPTIPFDPHRPSNTLQARTLLEMVHRDRLVMVQSLGPGEKAAYPEPFFVGDASKIDGQVVGGTDKALDYIFAQTARSRNLYVGIANFKTPRAEKFKNGKPIGVRGDKTAANASGCRVLAVDLDVEPDREDRRGTSYPTRGNALAALEAACRETGVPHPSIVVDSGRGFHCWWLLDVELHPAAWKALATGFKQLMGKVGLKFDPARTTDIAGVLRVPGTGNFKEKIPTTVQFHDINPGPVPVEAIRKIVEDRVGAVPDIQERRDDGSSECWGQANPLDIRAFCGQFRLSLETGGWDDGYSIWMPLLATCGGIDGGRALAHELSRGWVGGYNPATVDTKFDQLTHPCRCETFEAARPGPCLACPSRGLIATPLQLDTNRTPPPDPDADDLYDDMKVAFFAALDRNGDPAGALGAVLKSIIDPIADADDDDRLDAAQRAANKLLWLAAHRGTSHEALLSFAEELNDPNDASSLAARAVENARKGNGQ